MPGLECGSPMLLKLDRSNTCLGLFLRGISLVAALQCLLETLGKENGREVWTPAPAVGPKRLFEFDDESIALPKGRGVYFEDRNVECALKSQEKTAASRRSGRSRRGCTSPSNLVPDNLTYHLNFKLYLVFRVCS